MKTEWKITAGVFSLLSVSALLLAQDKPSGSAQSAPAPKPPPQAVATNSAATNDFPVIGYIEKRGRIITLKAGPKGTLYSAKTTEGKVLFENLSAEQLRAKAPDLQEFFKSAVGETSGKSKPYADARVRL